MNQDVPSDADHDHDDAPDEVERRRTPSILHPWARLGADLVHISQVGSDGTTVYHRDEAFVCMTPHCGQRMIPRAETSRHRRHHFSHLGAACGSSFESVIHQAAKVLIGERRHLRLPALAADPFASEPIELEPARDARWTHADEEETILDRWRGDLVMRGEIGMHDGATMDAEATDAAQGAFLLVDEDRDDAPPMVVEVVVTSEVAKAKIQAIQRAGWRLLVIRLDPDVAARADLDRLVLETAPREWLAHPAWQPVFDRMAEADAREIEEREKRDGIYVAGMLARMEKARPPLFVSTREGDLEDVGRDYLLEPFVRAQLPYAHHLAAAPEWWRLHLLLIAAIEPLEHGLEPIVPRGADALALIEGYILPGLPANPPKRLLAGLRVEREQWGTATLAVEAFMEHMVSSGLLVEEGGVTTPGPWLREAASRHREIRRLVMVSYQRDMTAGDATSQYGRWKSAAVVSGGPPRREIIARGDDGYEAVLSEARRLAARAGDAAHQHAEPTTAMRPMPKRSRVPMPICAPTPPLLRDVREGLIMRRFTQAPASASVARASDVVATVARSAATVQPTNERERLTAELRREATKHFARSKGRVGDQSARVELFMRNTLPGLGRPVDACVDRVSFDRFKLALATMR